MTVALGRGRSARDAPVVPNAPEVEAAFQAVPDVMIGQIIDGELHTQPRPAHPHTRASSVLGGELYNPFQRGRGGPGGWVILDEPEVHLGRRPDKLVPDLAGWRRERMPDAVGTSETPYDYDLAPDWVCEVLSPSTERVDRIKKMRIYAREGVRHVWLVNPILKTLEVYRLEEARWLLVDSHEGDALVKAEPFDALELELGVLWA